MSLGRIELLVSALCFLFFLQGDKQPKIRLPEKMCEAMREVEKLENSILEQEQALHKQAEILAYAVALGDFKKIKHGLDAYLKLGTVLRTAVRDHTIGMFLLWVYTSRVRPLNEAELKIYIPWQEKRIAFMALFQKRLQERAGEEQRVLKKALELINSRKLILAFGYHPQPTLDFLFLEKKNSKWHIYIPDNDYSPRKCGLCGSVS